MTVAEALAAATAALADRTPSARLDAQRLLLHALDWHDGAWLVAHGDKRLPAESSTILERLVGERRRGVPIAYLIGETGFFGRTFSVTPDVLVPRPETEHLIELALAFERERLLRSDGAELHVCDVGTGSGILAITLACELPDARVTAVDLSVPALAVAKKNARAHGVLQRITFCLGDAFDGFEASGGFDVIVANLPYVRSEDLKPAPDPTAFEPRLALDGGPDGLDPYRRLLARAPYQLAADGVLFMEAAPDTADELATLAAGAFEGRARTVVHRDYAARERVVEARREALPGAPKCVIP